MSAYFRQLGNALRDPPGPSVLSPIIWFGVAFMLLVGGVWASGAELCIKAWLLVLFAAYVCFYMWACGYLMLYALRSRHAYEKVRKLLGLGDREHGIVTLSDQPRPRGKRVTEQETKRA